MEDPIIILESDREEEIASIKDQNLGSIKGEIMGDAGEENGNLKFLLASLVKDYQSLQTNFIDTTTSQQDHKPTITTQEEATKVVTLEECDDDDEVLVSLSLGVSSSSQDHPITMDDKKREKKRELDDDDEGLALGLDIRFDPSPPPQGSEATNNYHSHESSIVEEGKEEEPSEMWPPSKVLKTMKGGDKSEASHHQQQTQHKKTRVSIRARCDTQTMNDGCQWRKYGQKIAKGNPCPRAYYRCTVSSSCPVRKQVQRCAEDMSILITTYEGTHNHPLPLSATAMASTTSAAASMLQSPSLISRSQQQGLPNNSDNNIMPPIIINSSTPHNPNNNNNSSTFSSLCQISSPHQQFQFPNSSIYSSTSYNNHNNSHPTITLDLTTPSSSSSGFSYTPRYPSSTNLNFSSNFSPLQYSAPFSSTNAYSGYFNSGTTTLTQNRSNQGGGVYVINSGSSQQFQQGNLHQMNNHNIFSQHPLSDIAAATKAITTNPKFQSALATALITTYVGNNNGGVIVGDRLKEFNHVAGSSSTAPLMNLKLSSNGEASSSSSSSSRYLFSNAQQENGNSSIMFPLPLQVVSKGSPAVSSSNNRSNQFLEQWK